VAKTTIQPTAHLIVPRIRTLRESALWVFAGVALILLVALGSYDPGDPAFSVAGEGRSVTNRIGPAGAWFADLAYMLFGRPAYLFPVMVLLLGWLLFRERRNPAPISRGALATRIGGFFLTLATSCGLASLHFASGNMRETAGGILGQLVGGSLEAVLSLLGGTVLLLVLWLAAVSLFTGVSWLAVMDRLGRGLFALAGFLESGVDRLRLLQVARQARQARQEVVTASRVLVQHKETPRIEPILGKAEISQRAERERQVPLFTPSGHGELPPMSLLDDPPPAVGGYSAEALEAMSRLVELKLADFGIDVEVVAVHPGPVITRFEVRPGAGVKVSQISNLAKDLARSLSVVSVRVVEVIPGKPVVGLEIPNESREVVSLGEIIKSRAYDDLKAPLTLALGKDISGQPIVADLARMPHLLIAGTTGSGKSVAINAMVLSLLYKSTPEHVRLIMIDPKMLELSVYEGIPHLLTPVVTDMNDAANALRWCVAEMERRYGLMAALGVRNIGGYNRKVLDAIEKGEPLADPSWQANPEDPDSQPETLEALPYVVVIIDELADMMMLVGKKVEELIARLAQKARASGIHMIIATQRPSVDVITGLIKANIPTRIAFQVSAKVDSRTILDQMGAETLLGHGDMLFLPPGTSMPTRIHGAFVSDDEVHTVVGHLRASGSPTFIEEILDGPSGPIPGMEPVAVDGDAEQDPLYDQAVRIVTETRKASISGVQRRLKIGYNRAARMVERMEETGLVGPLQSNGAREVLAPPPPSDD
jgi:S-DNA-T family DNA segregation ATPase FtsK/SpoIIIE